MITQMQLQDDLYGHGNSVKGTKSQVQYGKMESTDKWGGSSMSQARSTFSKKIKNTLTLLVISTALIISGAGVPGGLYEAYAAPSGGNVHYIAVSSDRHENTHAIEAAMTGMPPAVEYVCLNGDMSSSKHSSRPESQGPGPGFQGPGFQGSGSQDPYNTSEVLAEVQSVFPKLGADNISIIYADHDANATDDADIMKCVNFKGDGSKMIPTLSGSGEKAVSAGASGEIFEGPDGDSNGDPDYYVYGVSFYDMTNSSSTAEENGEENDFGEKAGGENAATVFKAWAAEIDPSVPIIVIGHVPLHYKRGDNLGADYWNKALNYAATGYDVVDENTPITRQVCYIYGHNHTVDKNEYFTAPGDTIDVQLAGKENHAESVIQYSYLTGGYLNENHTASLITVKDGMLFFDKSKGYIVKYDSQGGSDVASQGVHEGSLAAKPSRPKREGWHLTGWYKEAACENEWNFAKNTVSEDITLYAGWVKGEKPAAVKISTAVSAAKKQATVKWAKEASASDHRVSYRLSGASKWNRIWANGSTSVTISGLKAKGLYEFKVNSVYESGDRMIYSDDSNISYGYIATVSKVKTEGKKKSIKVSWKQDKSASGYQVRYSLKKNMKGAVTVNVVSGKKACTIKKLKQKTRYYVQVRPLKKSGEAVYTGSWTKKRVVRTK